MHLGTDYKSAMKIIISEKWREKYTKINREKQFECFLEYGHQKK
jgi:hypothetical protein